MTRAARPHVRSASMRSSVAASRNSSALSACVSTSWVRGTSASSGPRHSPSASLSSAAARCASSVSSALLASVTSNSKT